MSKPDEQANLPPIPDGGLSESMPEWLRRPPAWRTLKDTEVVPAEPVTTTTLPEPDTSVIDPREFLTDDDLPAWLRGLGRGRDRVASAGDDEPLEGIPGADPAQPETAVADRDGPPKPARFVPVRPLSSASEPTPTAASQPPLEPVTRVTTRESAWWQRGPLVALLGLLLVAAIVLIVILTVT